MKENMPCKRCGKMRMIDSSKISTKDYLRRSPRCRKCASLMPSLRKKISKGWFKKGLVPWSKSNSHLMPAPWNKGITGYMGANITSFKKNQIAWNKGLPHMQDEKHPNWAGNKVGYEAIHSWVRRKLGTPTVCCECLKSGLSGKKIHWANISKKYKRDLKDWVRLCVSCHKKYDLGLKELLCVSS